MTEPQKLTSARLRLATEVNEKVGDPEVEMLLAHIAAVEQERRPMCTGCGSVEDLDAIRARGALSCCPERNMVDPWSMLCAAIARAEAAEAALTEWRGSVMSQAMQQRNEANFERDVLRDRGKVLEAELRWQPIETAPKDGTVILMTDGVVVSAGHWKGPDPQWVEWRPNWIVAHFVHSSPVINENITHWMPLPALSPPATEDAKP